MVYVPRLSTATAGNVDAAVLRPAERSPTVLAQLPGDVVDRDRRARVDRGPLPGGPAPDAPTTQPSMWTRIGAGVAAYSVGQIVTVGALAALGAVGWPVLLAGVLGGAVVAKATDNYLTTGRIGLFGY